MVDTMVLDDEQAKWRQFVRMGTVHTKSGLLVRKVGDQHVAAG